MIFRRFCCAIGIVMALMASCPPLSAGVVVLSNLSDAKISLTIVEPGGRQAAHRLERFDVLSVPTDETVVLKFDGGSRAQQYALQADGMYYFRSEGSELGFHEDPLPGVEKRHGEASPAAPVPGSRDADSSRLCTIPVKILVDDKEPRVRRLWEKAYRQRLSAASEIFERYCRVRFKVVAVDTWTSNSDARHMDELIGEFNRTVTPAPARLAIGFTGQYNALKDDKHIGVSRGPFRSHILIREWGRQITEPERLEILVHELGHFLGAAHSSDPRSAMRPDLSDRQSRARGYRIHFDAADTLIMCLCGEELRARPIFALPQLSPETKDTVRAAYQLLARRLPNDPAAGQMLRLLDMQFGPPPLRR